MIGQAGAILEELEKRRHKRQRDLWAGVAANVLEENHPLDAEYDGWGITRELDDRALEQLYDKHYERISGSWDSEAWEEHDRIDEALDELDAAIQIVRDVIAFGTHAFDPSHPRFKNATD